MLLFNVLLKIYAVLAHNCFSKKAHQSHPVKINSRSKLQTSVVERNVSFLIGETQHALV